MENDVADEDAFARTTQIRDCLWHLLEFVGPPLLLEKSPHNHQQCYGQPWVLSELVAMQMFNQVSALVYLGH